MELAVGSDLQGVGLVTRVAIGIRAQYQCQYQFHDASSNASNSGQPANQEPDNIPSKLRSIEAGIRVQNSKFNPLVLGPNSNPNSDPNSTTRPANASHGEQPVNQEPDNNPVRMKRKESRNYIRNFRGVYQLELGPNSNPKNAQRRMTAGNQPPQEPANIPPELRPSKESGP